MVEIQPLSGSQRAAGAAGGRGQAFRAGCCLLHRRRGGTVRTESARGACIRVVGRVARYDYRHMKPLAMAAGLVALAFTSFAQTKVPPDFGMMTWPEVRKAQAEGKRL